MLSQHSNRENYKEYKKKTLWYLILGFEHLDVEM
jgi:hypothetical protein